MNIRVERLSCKSFLDWKWKAKSNNVRRSIRPIAIYSVAKTNKRIMIELTITFRLILDYYRVPYTDTGKKVKVLYISGMIQIYHQHF